MRVDVLVGEGGQELRRRAAGADVAACGSVSVPAVGVAVAVAGGRAPLLRRRRIAWGGEVVVLLGVFSCLRRVWWWWWWGAGPDGDAVVPRGRLRKRGMGCVRRLDSGRGMLIWKEGRKERRRRRERE